MPRKKSFKAFCGIFEHQMRTQEIVQCSINEGGEPLPALVARGYEHLRVLIYEMYLYRELYNRFEAPTKEDIRKYYISILKQIEIEPENIEEAEFLINLYKRG